MGNNVFNKRGEQVPWQTYIAGMQNHDWGDEKTLVAVSVLFRVSIRLIQDNDTENAKQCMRDIVPPATLNIPPCDELVVVYSDRSHYESTRPLRDVAVCQKFRTLNTSHDQV